MSKAAGKVTTDSPRLTDAELPQTPRDKNPGQGNGTQRITLAQRPRTGMAKGLEMAFINDSVKNTPVRFPDSPVDTDTNGTSAMPGNLQADHPPSLSTDRLREGAPKRNKAVSSPYLHRLPDPNRPAPMPPGKVPPLKIPVPSSDTPLPSPAKSSSARKVERAISEKFTPVKKTLAELFSPSSEEDFNLDGVEWGETFSEIEGPTTAQKLHPPLARSPLAEVSHKRKPEYEIGGDKKRVRFSPLSETPGFANSVPIAVPERQSLSSNLSEIDHLSKELAKSPIKKQYTGARTGAATQANGPAMREELQSPIHVNVPKQVPKNVQRKGSTDKAAFPFPPTELAKHAIEARLLGKPWISKASGDSVAGHLQKRLEKLMKANPGKINQNVYMYLQQLFGLLPAGAKEEDKTFQCALEQALANLGLSFGQWSDIEKFHQDFDKLDISAHPEAGAEFKEQLGKIIDTKNRLRAAQAPANEKASKGNDD